jgi:phosphohistidine phosphatase
MKTLLVLRHAKASHDDASASDHARPLTKKGRKAARVIGGVLREEGLLPELVLSSTAERAKDTAEGVREAAGLSREISLLDELYLAEPPAYLDALRRFGGEAERVLVVGHNPGIEALLFRLTGETQHMPTAALAECALPITNWSELGPQTLGKLRKVWRPKEIDG